MSCCTQGVVIAVAKDNSGSIYAFQCNCFSTEGYRKHFSAIPKWGPIYEKRWTKVRAGESYLGVKERQGKKDEQSNPLPHGSQSVPRRNAGVPAPHRSSGPDLPTLPQAQSSPRQDHPEVHEVSQSSPTERPVPDTPRRDSEDQPRNETVRGPELLIDWETAPW